MCNMLGPEVDHTGVLNENTGTAVTCYCSQNDRPLNQAAKLDV